MNQKGFANIILILIVLALIDTGVYFVSSRQITAPTPSPTPSPTPIPTLSGQACGGFITNPKTCQAGYHCYSIQPDMGGTCVPDSQSTPPPPLVTPPPPSPTSQADFRLDETSNNITLKCEPGYSFVKRVMGGWITTNPSDPNGQCISDYVIQNTY